MQYQKQTFTLPAAPARITQTDWEIAVGLRNPDGTLVKPTRKRVSAVHTPPCHCMLLACAINREGKQ